MELLQVVAGVPGPLAQGHNLEAADGWRAVEPQRLGSGWGHHLSAWYRNLLSEIKNRQRERERESEQNKTVFRFFLLLLLLLVTQITKSVKGNLVFKNKVLKQLPNNSMTFALLELKKHCEVSKEV